MAKTLPGSTTEFTVTYKNEWIKISTNDHIRFFLEFENGQRKEMGFEVGIDFDLAWTFVPDTENKQALEIGRLIEKKMWAA